MEIKIYQRNVYGQTMIYPLCETAKKLCGLAGKKTFTSLMITQIKALGYVFVQRNDPQGMAF